MTPGGPFPLVNSECILSDEEEKVIAEKKVRGDFVGLCLDMKDRFRAEALKADSQQEWIAYNKDQTEFSDLWAQIWVDVQGNVESSSPRPIPNLLGFPGVRAETARRSGRNPNGNS